MKNSRNLLMSCILIAFILAMQACEKEEMSAHNSTIADEVTIDNHHQMHFAKMLTGALNESQPLRELLKSEALKQFDKDYDVLYNLIRNKSLGKETVHELLSKYDSNNKLAEIEAQFPLLTIYVPVLPEFSAETWNPQTETPQVAITVSDDESIPVIDSHGKVTKLSLDQVPVFPVVVIKENERVVVRGANDSHGRSNNLLIQGSNEFSFAFSDQAFDGIHEAPKTSRLASSDELDPAVISAYDLKMDWHRDHIYYGLTPTTTKGKFRNNYSEFITSFRIIDPIVLNKISDQTGDPKPRNKRHMFNPGPYWTEGNFEFKITVGINSKNGIGTDLTKVFAVTGQKLFKIEYERKDLVFHIKKITPREFKPNIELLPWDLENYGSAWKIVVYEYDPAEQTETIVENSTTYASNFDLDANFGEKIKVGLKFGMKETTTQSRKFIVKSTLDSDFLGETALLFDQGVIVNKPSASTYTTKEIGTGMVSMSIEPRRTF
jgi:hypothetical protein